MKLLLSRGADYKVKDNLGNTTLLLASSNASPTLVRDLLRETKAYGIEVLNKKEQSPLLALIDDRSNGKKQWREHFDFDIPDFDDTIQCTAELLLRHGANINAQDNEGNTPLMLVAKYKDKETVQILLEHGVSTTLKNKKDETALNIAKKFPVIKKAIEDFINTSIESQPEPEATFIPRKGFVKR